MDGADIRHGRHSIELRYTTATMELPNINGSDVYKTVQYCRVQHQWLETH